jgi:hypothetical protein
MQESRHIGQKVDRFDRLGVVHQCALQSYRASCISLVATVQVSYYPFHSRYTNVADETY